MLLIHENASELIVARGGYSPVSPDRPCDYAIPTCRTLSQRAQGRSSKAEGLRASGLCLTELSTLAISVWLGKA